MLCNARETEPTQHYCNNTEPPFCHYFIHFPRVTKDRTTRIELEFLFLEGIIPYKRISLRSNAVLMFN